MTLLDVLGSKSRLKLLRELSEEAKYVSELAECADLDGKTTVHHLSVLEDAGIVEPHYVSNRKYYRLVKAVRLEATPPPERSFILQAQGRERTDDGPTSVNDRDDGERAPEQ